MEKYVHEEPISTDEIIVALRKGTLSGKLTPVLCGTALRNKGVRLLLDAVIAYLTQGTVPAVGLRCS